MNAPDYFFLLHAFKAKHPAFNLCRAVKIFKALEMMNRYQRSSVLFLYLFAGQSWLGKDNELSGAFQWSFLFTKSARGETRFIINRYMFYSRDDDHEDL